MDEFDQPGAPMEADFTPSGTSGPVELPPAELGNLSAIAQVGYRHPVDIISIPESIHGQPNPTGTAKPEPEK